MRQRIVLATVAVLAVALLAFAVPLAIAVRGLLVTRALDELQSTTEQIAVFIDEEARTCGQVELFLAFASSAEGPGLALFAADGTLLRTVAGHRPTVGAELAEAVGGTVGRRYGGGSLSVAVPLDTRACGERLLLHGEQDDAGLTAAVRRSWLGLLAVGVAVLGLGVGAVALVARRLARPLDHLAASAGRLGEGDFSVRTPRSGLPEVDAIADALDTTAQRLGRSVERGRAFTADASHQLRTPLTALRLHLEAVSNDPAAAEALAEADRLEATIGELVALTELDATEQVLDPAALVNEPVAAIRVVAATRGRAVALEIIASPPVRVRAGAVRQALQVLLDNAIEHGQGTVLVAVAPTLPDQPERGARICVGDEGPGPSPEVLEGLRARDRGAALPLTGGRGLRLARLLIEGEGGRLVAERVPTGSRVCLVLPAADAPVS